MTIIILFGVVSLKSCIEPINPQEIGFANLLIVESLLTSTLEHQKVELSRTIPLDTSFKSPESGADVWIQTNSGRQIFFSEDSPGTYLTSEPYAATFGTLYQLFIVTANGKRYSSDELEMLATPPIDSIYAEFEPSDSLDQFGQGTFKFFVDFRTNSTESRFFKWNWKETFKLRVGNASNLKWLGGNNVERWDPPIEICYKGDASSSVIVSTSNFENKGIVRKEIKSLDSRSRKMLLRYSLEVSQHAISEESFDFWNAVASNNDNQSSLSYKQPGSISGNIRILDNENEIVLGNFDVAQVISYRKFFTPFDFKNNGYIRSSRNFRKCEDSQVLITSVDQIGNFMEANSDRYMIWFISSGVIAPPGVLYVLKECADCTLYGTNIKPDFWID